MKLEEVVFQPVLREMRLASREAYIVYIALDDSQSKASIHSSCASRATILIILFRPYQLPSHPIPSLAIPASLSRPYRRTHHSIAITSFVPGLSPLLFLNFSQGKLMKKRKLICCHHGQPSRDCETRTGWKLCSHGGGAMQATILTFQL